MIVEVEIWQVIGIGGSIIGAAIAFYVDSAKKFAQIQTEMNEVKAQNRLLFSKNDRILEVLSDMKVQIAKIDNHEKR